MAWAFVSWLTGTSRFSEPLRGSLTRWCSWSSWVFQRTRCTYFRDRAGNIYAAGAAYDNAGHVQAVIRMGHLFPSATDADWVLREILPVEGPGPLAHVNGHSIQLGVDHLIASNPNRSRRGAIELREDVAWREMSAPRRWRVSALTFPLLLRYGYRARPTPPRTARALTLFSR